MTPADQWEASLRNWLILMMVRDMGMTYERAIVMTCPEAPSPLLEIAANVFRDQSGTEDALRRAV